MPTEDEYRSIMHGIFSLATLRETTQVSIYLRTVSCHLEMGS